MVKQAFSTDGDPLGVSIGANLSDADLTGETAYLDVSACGGGTVYRLHGPSVTAGKGE